MKSVVKRIQSQNPSLSSIVCFNKAISEYKYDRATINKYFDELVDKGDYMRRDRDDLLEYCYKLSEK